MKLRIDTQSTALVELALTELPAAITVNGVRLLRKSEYHISLVCIKRLAPLIDPTNPAPIATDMANYFRSYIEQHPINTYTLTREFRFVTQEERKSVIVMTPVDGLADLFDALQQRYNAHLPTPPTHITLYTLQPEAGIWVTSSEDLAHNTVSCRIPELDNLKRG